MKVKVAVIIIVTNSREVVLDSGVVVGCLVVVVDPLVAVDEGEEAEGGEAEREAAGEDEGQVAVLHLVVQVHAEEREDGVGARHAEHAHLEVQRHGDDAVADRVQVQAEEVVRVVDLLDRLKQKHITVN